MYANTNLPPRARRRQRAPRCERRARATLERLADWLITDAVAFRKLDAFRVELGLDVAAMARLLGTSPSAYAKWRQARAVPLRGRDKMHEGVLSYLRATEDAQNDPNEAVLGSLAGRLHGVSRALAFRVAVPCRTTPAEGDWDHAPHLWLGLEDGALRREREQAREVRRHEIRQLHGAGCECVPCAAPREARSAGGGLGAACKVIAKKSAPAHGGARAEEPSHGGQ